MEGRVGETLGYGEVWSRKCSCMEDSWHEELSNGGALGKIRLGL